MIAAAARPNGTLMKNTHGHESWSVMKPPASGPAMLATPHTLEKTPWIFARSSVVYTSATIVMPSGTSAPAPSPWTARKTMSWVIEVARPHKTDPPRNARMPSW
jgi:hypothetical protein